MPLAAKNNRVLPPSSHWNLKYDEDSCALQRGFGEEGGAILLELRQFAPGPGFQLLFASVDFDLRNERPEIRYGGDEENRLIENAIIADYGDDLHAVILSDSFHTISEKEEWEELDANERARWNFRSLQNLASLQTREESIEAIGIAETFGEEITLQTGSMRAPMDAMRQCMDELLTHWGVDAEAHRSLIRPALPRNYNRLVRRVIQNYPSAMLRQGNNARLQVRLSVSEAGDVTGCYLQLPIEFDDFRQDACHALERARFDPALDAQGNPIASYWTSTILYLMN